MNLKEEIIKALDDMQEKHEDDTHEKYFEHKFRNFYLDLNYTRPTNYSELTELISIVEAKQKELKFIQEDIDNKDDSIQGDFEDTILEVLKSRSSRLHEKISSIESSATIIQTQSQQIKYLEATLAQYEAKHAELTKRLLA